jgi:hypothetical protein
LLCLQRRRLCVLLHQVALVLLLLLLRGVVVLVREGLHHRSVRRWGTCCSTGHRYMTCVQ